MGSKRNMIKKFYQLNSFLAICFISFNVNVKKCNYLLLQNKMSLDTPFHPKNVNQHYMSAWSKKMKLSFTEDCMKSVQMRTFFWSLFSSIRTEYAHLRNTSPFSVQIQENTDHKKLHIRTLFTHWNIQGLKFLILAIVPWQEISKINKSLENKGLTKEILLKLKNIQYFL